MGARHIYHDTHEEKKTLNINGLIDWSTKRLLCETIPADVVCLPGNL